MSAPTQAEIEIQLQKSAKLLYEMQNFADGTLGGAGGLFDDLLQNLEGNYTAVGLAGAVAGFRGGVQALLDPNVVRSFMVPIISEYARFIKPSFGSGYGDPDRMFRAVYEYFVDNSRTIQSRNITYDTTETKTGTGNGTLHRVTVDQNGNSLEACTPETKTFRCRRDKNSGAQEAAETFEVLGDPAGFDNLEAGTLGSGENSRTQIQSSNPGTGASGSGLNNSFFGTYDASATNRFSKWVKVSGATEPVQETTETYRKAPGQTAAYAMLLGGSTLMRQTRTDMRVKSLDPNAPYTFSIMVNADGPGAVTAAVGGNIVIRMGSRSKSVAISALSGWTQVRIDDDENCWFANFNQDDMRVEIEWESATSGELLIADAIFRPLDLIDGTYWQIRGGSTPWLVDDTIAVTDTGGAPGTGKIQYLLQRAGFGYLPSTTGTPTVADPA